jgi:hypothetical protein
MAWAYTFGSWLRTSRTNGTKFQPRALAMAVATNTNRNSIVKKLAKKPTAPGFRENKLSTPNRT